MNGIFSYNSKFFQTVLRASNMVLLNVLYLACCAPIITIGPAQAGMLNAMRVFQDPDDDSSYFKAFFRGFRNGFGVIALINSVCLCLICAMLALLISIIYMDAIFENAPIALTFFLLVVILVFQFMAVAFHSRFQCSTWQIIRNTCYMILMHPIRAVLLAGLIWMPLLIAVLDPYIFLKVTPVWMFIYYSLGFYCCAKLIRVPFAEIEEKLCQSTYAENKIEGD